MRRSVCVPVKLADFGLSLNAKGVTNSDFIAYLNLELAYSLAMIALSSKVVAKYKEKLAALTVQAVLKVADKETKEVNLELIKIVSKVGGSLEETELIEGVLIDKDFSHPQMEKRITDAKVAVLTCPFEPPKPKTKYNLNITNAKDFKELA